MLEETPVQHYEEPKARERLKPSNEWEIKDRMYYLKGGKKPLSRSIKSCKHISSLMKKKVTKESLKYCQNQKTSFVDEMKGDQRLEHIFLDLEVYLFQKEKTVLQKLLIFISPSQRSDFIRRV